MFTVRFALTSGTGISTSLRALACPFLSSVSVRAIRASDGAAFTPRTLESVTGIFSDSTESCLGSL